MKAFEKAVGALPAGGMEFYRAYEERIAAYYADAGVARTPVDYTLLEQRVGGEALGKRLRRQLDYVEINLGQGIGLLKFGPVIDRLNLIPLALKTVGMLARGQRNAACLHVEEQEVCLPSLPDALEGYRVLQLSDLHFECDPRLTDVLIENLRDLAYDLCVVTGDYRLKTYGPHEPAMIELQRVVDALNAPVFGILGNHDAIEMLPQCEAMGFPLLMNEGIEIEHRGARFYLAGVDDDHYYRAADVERALAGRSDVEQLTVMLSHSTEIYATAAARGVDVMLSGHTHGGQICLPGGLPLLNNARSPRRMVSGRWQFGKLQGYTSRGSGCVSAPVRFNCPPEVTVHTFRSRVGERGAHAVSTG